MAGNDRRFYVYELFDPRDGVVFYVGKGCGKRDRSHIAEARRGEFRNPAKVAAIRSLVAAGVGVGIRRVLEGLSEAEAFRAERKQIAQYGFASLTNIMSGTSTDQERAEAMARDGLEIMCAHVAALFSGERYSKAQVKVMFQAIRELRPIAHPEARA